MQFKTFMLPAGGAEETENQLNIFLRSHKIVSVRHEFYSGVNPSWCILVEYVPFVDNSSNLKNNSDKIDYIKVLPPEQFSVFSKLREMRKKISEEMKIPPFVIYTDEQLAEIVKINPSSLTQLGSINGIGEGKLAKYGKITLQTLNEINNNLQQEKEKSNEKSL